jgi:hypothetical protein
MRLTTAAVVFWFCWLFLTASIQAQLIINPTYDTSLTSLSNFAAIKTTIDAAAAEYATHFSNHLTIGIKFQNMATGVGMSNTLTQTVDYFSYRSALGDHATTADDFSVLSSLPLQGSSPVNGSDFVTLTIPNAKVLGLFDGFSAIDSTISLHMSVMNITRPPGNPTLYDLKAVVQHEIDEALGTLSGVGGSLPFSADHSRFGGPGVFSFSTSSSASAYFSVDGGVTRLVDYNQSGIGDYGDWALGPFARVQDFQATPGATPNLGVELRLLDVIGFSFVSVPEPGSLTLVFAGILIFVAVSSRRVFI